MSNQLTQRTGTDIFNFGGASMNESMQMAEMISHSDFVPKDYRAKPGNVLVAVQMGSELGLKPMQAMQNIAVINGRPCVWGDSLLGLVQANPQCEWVKESFDDANLIAKCEAKRKGNEHTTVATFSMHDAKVAGLANKSGPWTSYPKRMLALRARAFCLRNAFADVLGGLSVAEEVQDFPAGQSDTLNTAKAVLGGSDDQAPPKLEKQEVQEILEDNKEVIEEALAEAVEGEVVGPEDIPDEVKQLHELLDGASDINELNALTPDLAKAPDAFKEKLREVFKNKIISFKEKANA